MENIENHEKYCIFDKQLCKVCNFVANSEHDCLKSLLDYKQNMSIIMDKLGQELEDSNALSQNLRSQIDNYSRTIKDMISERSKQLNFSKANKRGNNPSSSSISAQVNNNKDLLVEARKYLNSPTVDGHKTRKDTVEKVTEMVKTAIGTKGDKMYDVARFIKEYMDTHYLGDWNVNLWYNSIGYIYYNGVSDSFIEIKFGKVTVAIYKTFDAVCVIIVI